MNYNLVKRDGMFYVEGLSLAEAWCGKTDTLLLVMYDEGDCDTVSSNGKSMHHALYDLFQTSETLKDGDTFSLDGVVAYRCEGVHVNVAD